MYLMPNIVRAIFSHPNLHNLCEIFTKSGKYNSETICTRTANNTTFPHNLNQKNPFMMFIMRLKVIAGVKIEVKVKYTVIDRASAHTCIIAHPPSHENLDLNAPCSHKRPPP